jgi:hypothetical protein
MLRVAIRSRHSVRIGWRQTLKANLMFRIIYRKERAAIGSSAWKGDLASAKIQAQQHLAHRNAQDGATTAEVMDSDTQKIVYSCTADADAQQG